jgi:hypothetical protein
MANPIGQGPLPRDTSFQETMMVMVIVVAPVIMRIFWRSIESFLAIRRENLFRADTEHRRVLENLQRTYRHMEIVLRATGLYNQNFQIEIYGSPAIVPWPQRIQEAPGVRREVYTFTFPTAREVRV